MLVEKSNEFEALCSKIGLAVLLGQKVQYALAYYYSVYHVINFNWSKAQAKESIERHLFKTMEGVISSIEKDAPLEQLLSNDVVNFNTLRNWLLHDFDEESTRYLVKGERHQDYLEKMEMIIQQAHKLMFRLNNASEKLVQKST